MSGRGKKRGRAMDEPVRSHAHTYLHSYSCTPPQSLERKWRRANRGSQLAVTKPRSSPAIEGQETANPAGSQPLGCGKERGWSSVEESSGGDQGVALVGGGRRRAGVRRVRVGGAMVEKWVVVSDGAATLLQDAMTGALG